MRSRQRARRLGFEPLEQRRLLAGDILGPDAAEIRGSLFEDLDGDGARGADEPGLAGVVVYADLNVNGAYDAASEPAVTSDEDGTYVLPVSPGEYIVRQVTPELFGATFPAAEPDVYIGTAYVPGENATQLVKIAPETGQVTRIGDPMSRPLQIHGLIQTNGGDLYGMNGVLNKLYRVDPTTGQPSLVGSTGYAVQRTLTYDPATDTIYTVGKAPSEDSALQLLVVDRETGNATPVGSGLTGVGIDGLSYDQANQRILGFSRESKVFVAFDTSGNAEVLSNVAAEISAQVNSRAVAYDGENIVMQLFGVDNNTKWATFDPDTGERLSVSMLSGPTAIEGLEFIPGVGRAHRVALGSGEVADGLDFGNRSLLADLRGSKFEDLNGNGRREANEPPMAGVTIYVDVNDDGAHQDIEPSTVTDGNGEYAFTDLPPGDYVLREVMPEGFAQTYPPTEPQHRLFAVVRDENAIAELDPDTGAEIYRFAAPTTTSGLQQGLAFDGTSLWFINGDGDTLYQLDPYSGRVLDADPLGVASWGGNTYSGLAALNGSIYILEDQFDQILEFDPVSDTITNQLQVYGIGSGLSAIKDPDRLVAKRSGSAVEIDPVTGTVTYMSYDAGSGAAVIDGEIYSSSGSVAELRVEMRNGTFLRRIPIPFRSSALGGDDVAVGDGAHRVSLTGTTIDGLDFGDQFVLGELRGTQFDDLDGDGARDPDEPASAGVTIYLDLNGDGALQATEPTAVTGANGEYAFTELVPGDYIVRQVLPDLYLQTVPETQPGRLFTSSFSSRIYELDPADGSVLNELRLGTTVDTYAGLAFDGKALYALSGTVSSTNDVLVELDPDTGDIRDATALPKGLYAGTAALDGLIYLLETSQDQLLVFDPTTDTIVSILDLRSANPDLVFAEGLGEIGDANQLIAGARETGLQVIDPTTGGVVRTLALSDGRSPSGLTSIGGQIFVLSFGKFDINVYTQDGELLRTIDGEVPALGLAGSDPLDATHRVTLTRGEVRTGLDFGNQKINLPPIADAGGPYVAQEGGLCTLDASGSYDPEGGLLQYQWDLDGDGVFGEVGVSAERGDEVGVNPEFSAAGLDGPSEVEVSLWVIDDHDHRTQATATIEIVNIAPILDELSITPEIDENDFAVLAGTIVDPGAPDTFTLEITWGDGQTNSISLDAGSLAAVDMLGDIVSWDPATRAVSVEHRYLDDGPSPGNGTASDQYAVVVSVIDDDGGRMPGPAPHVDVLVNNADPVILRFSSEATIQNKFREDEEVAFAATFTDAGTLDSHTVTIDWDDNSQPLVIPLVAAANPHAIDVTHRYAAGGVYTVTLTVRDDDTGTAMQNTTAAIIGAGVNDGVLQIVGDGNANRVTVNRQGNGLIKVHADFFPKGNHRTFDAASIHSIQIWLGDGDDHATIAGSIRVPAVLYGGGGDDHLFSGGSPAILIGGPGDDRLVEGPGGAVLIEGATIPEEHEAALLALVDEWDSGDA